MSYALCEHYLDKARNPQDKTTKIHEQVIRKFFDDYDTPCLSDLSSRIDDFLKYNATIVLTDIQRKSEILIIDKEMFNKWANNYYGLSSLLQVKVTCSFETKLLDSDIIIYKTREFTWKDYTSYEQAPMLELQIYDEASGCLLESRVYRTHSKLFAFLDKNIEKHETDETVITYKNRKCTIEVNGINISNYCTSPESNCVSIWSSPDNSCVVSNKCIIDGLF